MGNDVFLNSFHQSVSESGWLTVHVLRQVLDIRDGILVRINDVWRLSVVIEWYVEKTAF